MDSTVLTLVYWFSLVNNDANYSKEMQDGTKSIPKIFANIFIAFIGAGVLGVPYAFKEVRKVGKVRKEI